MLQKLENRDIIWNFGTGLVEKGAPKELLLNRHIFEILKITIL